MGTDFLTTVAGLSALDREGTRRDPFLSINRSFRAQFRARNWGGSQGQISRARLAVQIAKRIAEFVAVRFQSVLA
jgi:hypothetical protein